MPDGPIAASDEHRYLLRTYRGGDEMPLISLWNQSLPQDTIHPRAFVTKVLCDPNFDPEGAIVAVNSQEEAMGFVWALVRPALPGHSGSKPDSGTILALFVHPEHRRRGLGSALLRAAEQFVRARGCDEISFAPYGPGWMWQGLDRDAYPDGLAFFHTHGYDRQYTNRTWGRHLAAFAISEEVQRRFGERTREGYQFSPLTPGYVVSLTSMLAERFDREWARLVREAIAGETPFDQILLCTDVDGRLVGFAAYGVHPGAAARLGPIGIVEEHQKKGLGSILLHLCLDAMRSRGLQTVWASWPASIPPLDALLERSGFAAWRSFEVLNKRERES